MNNTDIITKLRTAMTDARQNESHFESWMILNEAICDAIDALAEQPAQQEPDQRLVNLLCRIHRDGGHYLAKHGLDKAVTDADIKVAELNAMSDTRPQAREWVGLTGDEIALLMMQTWGCSSIAPRHAPAFARAIEAKLKEKNA